MGMKVFGASVRGASHIRAGKECQDSHKNLIIGDVTILAVADGHGSKSCPFSRAGSKIAVNVYCKLMSEYCDSYAQEDETLMTFFNREGDTAVARAIDKEWKRRVEKAHRYYKREMPETESGEVNKPDIWKQYGTTLLGLIITPAFYFAFQLGDGDALILNESNAKYAVQGDKLLGTETHSLSHPDAWKRAVTTVGSLADLSTPLAFMLATDGFSNSYPTEASFLQTCVEYYAAIREHGVDAVASNLREWLDETSENGSGDDITVVFGVM